MCILIYIYVYTTTIRVRYSYENAGVALLLQRNASSLTAERDSR